MLSLHDTLKALAGDGVALHGSPKSYSAVSTDSRSIQPGELFVALRGETFDGHRFVRDVLAAGAAAAIVDRAWHQDQTNGDAAVSDLPLIVVDDTRLAFASLARAWRKTFAIPVIGVVGSNGKTTVKEMIASILAAAFGPNNRLATTGNLNNEIGVPTMLLRMKPQHQAAVIEMGMNHPGETAVLANITHATIAIINNAQREHQEFMKTVAAVAEEHAAVIAALPQDGTVVLNADDAFFDDWQRAAGSRKIISFGFNAGADVRIERAGPQLHLHTPQGVAPLQLNSVGDHNIRNALGATAATLAAGCSVEDVVAGLAAFTPVKGRLQIHAGLAGSRLIDDSYNANPDSVRAAIDVLSGIPGRRILVLGDMGEVGYQGAQYHDEVGGYAKSQGVDTLLTLGDMSVAATKSFGTGGTHFKNLDALVTALKTQLAVDVSVLIKGSRFMRMERVLDAVKLPESKTVTLSEGNQHAA